MPFSRFSKPHPTADEMPLDVPDEEFGAWLEEHGDSIEKFGHNFAYALGKLSPSKAAIYDEYLNKKSSKHLEEMARKYDEREVWRQQFRQEIEGILSSLPTDPLPTPPPNTLSVGIELHREWFLDLKKGDYLMAANGQHYVFLNRMYPPTDTIVLLNLDTKSTEEIAGEEFDDLCRQDHFRPCPSMDVARFIQTSFDNYIQPEQKRSSVIYDDRQPKARHRER